LKDTLPPKPGTGEFGERARRRGGRSGQEIEKERTYLRVKTAKKNVRQHVSEREKIQKEADE